MHLKPTKEVNSRTLVAKTLATLQVHGLTYTLRQTYAFLRDSLKPLQIFLHKGIEKRFTQIYLLNYWGNSESVSGLGSTMEYTKNLRSNLPQLFIQFDIKILLDAPCGDFNWMQHVVRDTGVRYIGGDIVKPLIISNNKKYATENIFFQELDLTKSKFPYADLLICRDCLFHLSFEDTKSVLRRFLESKIPFLLTTTHRTQNEFINYDIESASFRLINLFLPPYSFPVDVLFRIDDWHSPDPEREMCLWSRQQIEVVSDHFL